MKQELSSRISETLYVSAYKRIEVALKDKAILLKALHRLGLECRTTDGATLTDYVGNVVESPNHYVISKESLDKVFTGLSNDIGITITEDGCTLTVGDYDAKRRIPEKIKQAYAVVAIEEAMARQKFRVTPIDDAILQQKGAFSVEIVASKVI